MTLPWLPPYFVKVRFVSFSSPAKNQEDTSTFHTDGEAKFWLEPEIELAMSQGLSAKQIGEALALVNIHREEILHAWNSHFGN